jgi:hypothetical protein
LLGVEGQILNFFHGVVVSGRVRFLDFDGSREVVSIVSIKVDAFYEVVFSSLQADPITDDFLIVGLGLPPVSVIRRYPS